MNTMARGIRKQIVFKLVVCKEREASPTNENTNINPSTQYIVDYTGKKIGAP